MIAPSERSRALHLGHAVTHRPVCGSDSSLVTHDRLAFDGSAQVCSRCLRRLERAKVAAALAPEPAAAAAATSSCRRANCPCACHGSAKPCAGGCPCSCHAGDPVDW